MGVALMLISFFDLGLGISGLVAIITCQLCSKFFNFDSANIFDGSYTYNALMLGLAMGSFYQVGVSYFIVLVVGSMMCFFFTVWIAGRLSAKGLPFLSVPFFIAIWILLLGLSNFNGIKLISKEVFSLQQWCPAAFRYVTEWVGESSWRDVIHVYLRSLSAIIFQYNDLAGLVIAVLILIHSRMAFALTIYGFLLGYFFYYYFEGNFTTLIYSYIGFNFILSAIALGGFFIVPSAKSHLLLLFVIPVTALMLSALYTIFGRLQLPMYSLPYNIVVLLILGVLQMRYQSRGLQLVVYQQYSPELNHYKNTYYQKRFAGQTYYHLFLPVIGEWYIPQGQSGDITHKGEWQHAWDFDVRDNNGRTFRDPGTDLRNYYCYDAPVTAPQAGRVVAVKDGVQDNLIGIINTLENWGNTVIIMHAEGLYTKLSHLKPQSIKVKEGDYVRAGEVIASCGSSGRSPEPHLHFQVQATPYIGSHTLKYPLAYYLVKKEDEYSFHAFDIPGENETVRNVVSTPLLHNAFDFVPGKEVNWKVTEGGKEYNNAWTVYADAYNKKYLQCNKTNAVAYFVNDGVLFYFTDFYGDKHSLLYKFYISFHKVLLGYYKGAAVTDWLMPQVFFNVFTRSMQDFFAPFFHFIEGKYQFAFGAVDRGHFPGHITMLTKATGRLFHKEIKTINAKIYIDTKGIANIEIENGKHKTTAHCVY